MPSVPPVRSSLEILGDNLHFLRIEHGLTLEQLAEPDCDPSTLSRIEHGKQRPSARLMDSLLGRLGETTFPWGFLFCTEGIDQSIIRMKLLEELRLLSLMGRLAPYYERYTGRQFISDTPDPSYDRIPTLLHTYESYGLDSDGRLFTDFIRLYYLDFPGRHPDDIIAMETDMLAVRRCCGHTEASYPYFPNEIERIIISDMALRYMDMRQYDRAAELCEGLIEKQRLARVISPVYWRCIAVYRYNIALCALMQGNLVRATSYAGKALSSLQRGGDVLLLLYIGALYARIHRLRGSDSIFQKERAGLRIACALLRRHFGFAYDIDDLLSAVRGIATL